jgi:DNA-binding transcriptional regulator YdaS (Cro superfamily)
MKKLLKFINAFGGQTVFAKAIHVSQPAIALILAGKRQPSPKVCVEIEQVTNGEICRQQLRPLDWFQIWPELVVTSEPSVRKDTEV